MQQDQLHFRATSTLQQSMTLPRLRRLWAAESFSLGIDHLAWIENVLSVERALQKSHQF
jgi:hypothetical protein